MEKPRWAYYGNNSIRWDRVVLHYNFLENVKKEHSTLWCEYCGKDKLVLYRWDEKHDKNNMATVDHFLPKSKYPLLANDENNFIVACSMCNEGKKDDVWAEDTIKYPRKDTKSWKPTQQRGL